MNEEIGEPYNATLDSGERIRIAFRCDSDKNKDCRGQPCRAVAAALVARE